MKTIWRTTAQGDPFGPLALQLWMSLGLRYVRAHLPAEGAVGADKIYMDDRTFSAPSARSLLDKQDVGPSGLKVLVWWRVFVKLNTFIPM